MRPVPCWDYLRDLMSTDAEKLARIAALCDERSRDAIEADPIWPDEVYAILAVSAASPRAGAETLREQVIEAMSWAEQTDRGRVGSGWAEALLDRYLAIVHPVEALAPDRIRAVLADFFLNEETVPDDAPIGAWARTLAVRLGASS